MMDIGFLEYRGLSVGVFIIVEDEVVESEIWRGKKSGLSLKQGRYIVRNVYYRYKKYQDFVRTVTIILDFIGGEFQLGLLEYCFNGSEYYISFFKNFRSGKFFIFIISFIRNVIKEKVILYKGFSSIFDEFFEEEGGIVIVRQVLICREM